MADSESENYVEGNTYHHEDFETVEPLSAHHSENGQEIPEQDEEVTTTNSLGGEEPAEEDRYAPGASDADPVDHSSNLISWGDEESLSSQPSATVSESQDSAFGGVGDFSMGTVASEALQSEFSSRPHPPEAEQDIYPTPSQERGDVTSTEPFSVLEAIQETKAEGTWLKNVDPRAPTLEQDLTLLLDLIYWRDVRKTGVVFGSMLLVLLSLAFFSLLSVLAYLSLAILTVTLSFRVYKNIMAAVQKTSDGHPFKQYLDLDITLKEEKVSRVTHTVLQHINRSLLELRRLFLIEDLIDSIKFGLLLWVLTYVGAWFNGMTLIILLVVAIFTLPKVYETYKVQIDNYVNMARNQLNTVLAQVQSKVPFLKKKAKTQ